MPFNYNFGQRPVNRFAPNYDFRSGIQPNPNQLGRMSATFEQPVTNQPGYLPDQQPHDDQPPDFMSEYNKLMGSRPQRLAYQETVNKGPEQIKRSKWAMLGAALASGGAALGGTRAPEAAGLGISAYMQPQERADQDYKEKITRLGQSAGMEQSDIEDQLKALEYQQSDWYKRREDVRQQSQETRQGEESKAKIEELQTDKWTDVNGNQWKQKKGDALPTFIGKVGESPEEKVKYAGQQAGAIAGAQEQYKKSDDDRAEAARLREIDRSNAGAFKVATAQIEGRADVADKNNKARAAALKAKNDSIAAKGFKPGDTAKQVYNDLNNEFATNPELAGEDFNDYIEIKEGPGGNSLIGAKPEWSMGPVTVPDSIKTAAIKEAIRRAIARSIANSQAGKAGGGPATGTTKSGGKYQITPITEPAGRGRGPG